MALSKSRLSVNLSEISQLLFVILANSQLSVKPYLIGGREAAGDNLQYKYSIGNSFPCSVRPGNLR